jgi:hypothetical protein
MADKNFKVKKNIQVTDLAVAGPVTVDSSGVLASSSALAVNLGGTGQTTASAAFDALVPSQTNNANKLLGTDGTSVSWVSPGIAYQTSAPDNPVTGQLWVDSDETGDSLDPYIIRRKTITATAGQTVFTTDVVFTDGYEQIYYNGVLLVRTTDYTTSGGTNTVTLLQGASAGDTVEIISSTPINLVNNATLNANTFVSGQIIRPSSGNALEIIASSSVEPLVVTRNGAPSGLLSRNFNGTYESPTAITANQRTSFFASSMYGTTSYQSNAAINIYAAENQTDAARGTYINFETTPLLSVGRLERMRIDSAGNVGIGTDNPQARLHSIAAAGGSPLLLGMVASDTTSWIQPKVQRNGFGQQAAWLYTPSTVDANNPVWYTGLNASRANFTFSTFDAVNFNERVHITPAGYMLIGYSTSNGAYNLQVNSQIFATSSSIATSDGRYKEEVNTITNGLSIVDSLRPVSFKWKDHPVHNFVTGKTVGFIAQEVQEALADYDWADNIIKSNYNEETEEEFLGIAEANIIPLLVSAVKELKAEFEEYKRLHP